MDSLLKEMVSDLKSFVQGTRHVPTKIDEQGTCEQPDGLLLVGINVESLYKSITHLVGTHALEFFGFQLPGIRTPE